MARRRNSDDSGRSPLVASAGASKLTTCLCAAAALCCLTNTSPTEALVVVQSPIRAVGCGGGGRASAANWRGFQDARHARSPSSTASATKENVSKFCDHETGDVRRAGRGRASSIAGGSGGRRRQRRDSGRRGCAMSVWEHQTEEEWEFEEEVQRLEGKMARAVEKEKYDVAAKLRDKLFRIHMDETSAVLSTNSAFYTAFTLKDIERMKALWLPSRDVMCVHPGDEPIVGHSAVVKSWKSLFSAGDRRFTGSVISAADVKVRVRGTTAIVLCTEEVTTFSAAQSPWIARIKDDLASRAGLVGAEDEVLKGRGGGRGGGVGSGGGGSGAKKKKKPRYLNVTNIYRKAGGRWLMVHHHASVPPSPQTTKELRAAMGLGGLQLGEGSDGMSRIINLSDQSFNGINIDGKLDDMLESLRSQLPGGGAFSLGTGGMSGRLQTHGMLVVGEDDDDDDGDDDDVMGIKRGRRSRETLDAWGRPFDRRPSEAELARRTMQALRMLGEANKLGKREQRRLITDIIKHAGAKEISAVEVAYDLLVAQGEDGKWEGDDPARLTEFVEQAKILASALFEEDRRIKKKNDNNDRG